MAKTKQTKPPRRPQINFVTAGDEYDRLRTLALKQGYGVTASNVAREAFLIGLKVIENRK